MLRNAPIVIALSVSTLAEAQLPSPPPNVAPQVVKEDRYPAHNVTFGTTEIAVFFAQLAFCLLPFPTR